MDNSNKVKSLLKYNYINIKHHTIYYKFYIDTQLLKLLCCLDKCSINVL